MFVTLAAYQTGVVIDERCNRNPLTNPVAIAIILVASVVQAIDMAYARHFEGAQFVHFLQGAATVSPAVPICRGFAIGVAAHGLGTSRAFSINQEAGPYESLAMGMHGILGAIVIPLIVGLLRR